MVSMTAADLDGAFGDGQLTRLRVQTYLERLDAQPACGTVSIARVTG